MTKQPASLSLCQASGSQSIPGYHNHTHVGIASLPVHVNEAALLPPMAVAVAVCETERGGGATHPPTYTHAIAYTHSQMDG